MSRFAPALPWIALAALATASVGCKPKPVAGGGRGEGFVVQVVAVPVRQQAVVEVVPLVGSIAANESIEVKTETDGVVKEIRFAEGGKVPAGELLVALDDTKFTTSLGEAEANRELARANFDRAKHLQADKLIAQQEYDQAAATFAMNDATVELRRRQLRDTRVVAPFAGTVGARQVSPGQVISRATLLTTLVDLETVKVEMNVPERYLGQIQTGQKIRFRVDAYPKDRFEGDVYFVSPQLEAGTRTALVKARVANADGRLKAGMFAKLDLTVQLRENALVIPEPALMHNGDALGVFVVGPQSNAIPRVVTIGIRIAGKAEVTGGLKAGELVVVEGVQKLFPNAPVRLAPAAAAAPYLD
ncbi:MAG: efflux RND transporter periplasmic adaptor subunit [Verrucomicrobia bacterium]|nr:MAG: efflux RND transporter periplasmic adaptor subunit [Verrucomicrobiota bacterium]